MLEKEQEESGLNFQKMTEYLFAKSRKLENALSDQQKIREESEEQLVHLMEEMMTKIKDQLKNEQIERQFAEDALLRLLEEACVKLNNKQSI